MTKQNKSRKLFAVSASAALVASAIVPVASASADFNDAASISTWAVDSVKYATDNGIIGGKPGNVFDPKGTVLRGEAAKMLALGAGLEIDEEATTDFSDVQADAWFTPYIAAAVEAKIIQGKGEGKFAPNDKLTRAEAAVLFTKAYPELEAGDEDLAGFKDAAGLAEWKTDALKVAVNNGIIKGKGNGDLLAADQEISREEFAVILYRALEVTDNLVSTELEEALEALEQAVEAVKAFEEVTAENAEEVQEALDALYGAIEAVEELDAENEALEAAKELAEATEEALATSAEDIKAAVDAAKEETAKLPAAGSVNKENTAAAQAAVNAAQAAVDAANSALARANEEVTEEEAKAFEAAIKAEQAKIDAVKEAIVEANKPVVGLAVESVSAINAKQITVKFSAPVDEATATNPANYVFSYDGTKYTDVSSPTFANILETVDGVVLDEKTNTVTFTFKDANKLVNGKQLSLDVSDKILSADKTSKVAKYTGAVTVFSDTKAPSLTNAAVKSDKLVLDFDEEIATGSITTIKIDDVTVFSTVVGSATGSVTVSGSTVTVNETLANALKAVGTHNVVVYGATDKATPANTSQVTTASYTIENDVTAPTVQAVRAVEGNARAFDVVFSENVAVGSATFDVKKGNHTFTIVSNGTDSTVTNPANGTAAAQYKVVYFDLKADGKTNDAGAAKTTGNARVARVIFSDDVTGVTSSYVNPLYTTGENTTSLSVKVNGYKDTANLVGSEYNGSISLSKDLSAPVIKAGLDNKINGSGQLEVKFNKPVNVVDGAKITVKDKDGMPRTATVASGSGTDTLVLNVAGYTLTQANEKAPFTVEFAQGAVQAVSEKIFNSALSVVINRTATGDAVVDGVATVSASTLNAVTGVYDNVITITYPQPVDASAINLANYTLDNAALPANSKIEINNTDTVVKITLPEGFATVNNQKLLQISTNVKTKTGSAIVNSVTTKQPYSQLLSFSDNTQPTLVKAEYLVADTNTSTTTKRIKLTFNENLTNTDLTGNADAANDIELIINGAKKTVTVSDKVVGDNELVVVVADDLNISQSTIINVLGLTATNTSVAIKDGKGNVAKASTATATTKVFDIELANDEATATAAAAAFRTTHSAILGKTTADVATTDQPNLTAALSAYTSAPALVQTKLASEKTLLDSLQVKIDLLTAKAVIEAPIALTVPVANNTAADAKTYVEGQLAANSALAGFTIAVTDGATTPFTAADPGVSNGTYKFTVTLTKNGQSVTTAEVTATIANS